MINTEQGREFVCWVNVDRHAFEVCSDPREWDYLRSDDYWKYLKDSLIRKFYDEYFLKFFDGGWWTFNLLFIKEDINQYGPYTRLGVVGKIFKVRERTHVINTVSMDYSPPVMKKEWKILCAGCGNVFTPDRRGGCSGCGAPADWIKNWTLEAK